MATLPSEFIELAAELIGDEFAAFAVDTVVNKKGTFDYNTQTAPVLATSTIPTIVLDFEASQFNGQLIKVSDYMLIGEYQLMSFEPSPDNCDTIRDGVTAEIKSVNIDPAKAVIIMHVRPL